MKPSSRTIVSLVAAALMLGLVPVPASSAVTPNGLLAARQGVSALLRGQYEKAIESYNEALQDKNLSDPRRANIYNDRGVAKWRLGSPTEAIEDFNRAIKLFPDFAVVYNNRGNALIDLGRPGEAIADFDRAIAIAPAYGAAYNNRGNAHQLQGNFVAAERDFRKAVELLPRNAVPHNGLGKAHVELGRPFAAMREFKRAIQLNARYLSAHENRAAALGILEEHDEAVADYTQVIQERPEDAKLYLARGTSYANARKYNSAFRDFEKALSLAPDMAEVYVQRAKVHLVLKRFESALEETAKAIDIDGTLASAHAVRAEAFLELGLTQEALASVNRALAYEEKDAEALLTRAKVYDALQRNIEALEDYQAVLEADPGNADARKALVAAGKLSESAESAGQLGEPVKGWQVVRVRDGVFQALNSRFPKVRVPLEMYGEGQPKIIDWNLLKYDLRGIGLLEYYAGARHGDGKSLEYVAIVDLWKSKTVAVEPDRWGEAKATWDWRQVSVVVTDPNGNASEVQLRPQQVSHSSQGAETPYGERYWRERPRRSQRRRGPREGGGLFNWLFGD